VSLSDAIRTSRTLTLGAPGPLDPRTANGLAVARSEQVYLPLLFWVATLARSHAHFGAARELDDFGAQLARERGIPAEEALGDDTPPQLDGLGLDRVGHLTKSWWGRNNQAVADDAKAAGLPTWAVPALVAQRTARRGDRKSAAVAAMSLPLPSDPAARTLIKKLQSLLSAHGDTLASTEKTRALASSLVAGGFVFEAADLIDQRAQLAEREGPAAVLPWAEMAMEVLPEDEAAALGEFSVLIRALPAFESSNRLDQWALRAAMRLPQVSGKIPLSTEYEALRLTLQILPSVPNGMEAMAPVSTTFVAILRAQSGPNSPDTVSWTVLNLAAHAIHQELDPDHIPSVQRMVGSRADLDARFPAFVEALAAAQADPAEQKRLATEFIASLTR
jgi:hypothetical protein